MFCICNRVVGVVDADDYCLTRTAASSILKE